MLDDYLDILKLLHGYCSVVRAELAETYNVIDEKSNTYRYSGLCNIACDKLCKVIYENIYQDTPGKIWGISIQCVHGELRHNPSIDSKYWLIQHTWVEVQINGTVWYVDPTMSQFQFLFPDAPGIYVSINQPKYYLLDIKNFTFSKIGRKIDKVCHVNYDEVEYKLTEFVQYIVFGAISDWIRKHILK